MTFNKKYDQKKSDQARGGKRVRKGSDNKSAYKTENTGGTENKKIFEKDDYKKPFKSYSSKRNDNFRNDKPRSVKNIDFSRDYPDKRSDKPVEDRPGSYSRYRSNRSSEFGKSNYKRREDSGKTADRSSGARTRPYIRTRTDRNVEPGTDKPFRREDSDKRAERYSGARTRPYIHTRTDRNAEPGTDKPFRREDSDKRAERYSGSRTRPYSRTRTDPNAEPRVDKPFRRENADKSKGRYTDSRSKPYSSFRDKRTSETGKDDYKSGNDKPFRREGADSRKDRYSDTRSRPFSRTRERRDSEPGKNDYQSRRDKPFRKEGVEGSKYKRFSASDRKTRGSFENSKPGISTQSKPKQDDGLIRLNRYISTSGICSRREADDLISAGLITVNGKLVNELGSKVSVNDEVRYNGELIKKERNVYILLNKPKEYVTTLKDPYAKHTVIDLIKGACKERVFPVGRLDRNTTGVLLLTNDGELTKKLTHPSFNRKKIYHVFLDKNLKAPDLEAITNGLDLEDGFIKVDDISFVDADDKKQVGIEIHSGRNHIVRNIFEHLGYRVIRLDRVYFAGLTKKGILRGHWRFLTDQEVGMLKMGSFK